jgi:arylsulfatase A-like enzyme
MRTSAFIVLSAAWLAFCQPTSHARAVEVDQAATRPNVVLIVMDDMGYGDLGNTGAPDAKTPNIDRLAREGVRVTDAYANGPVCSPTRAALVTGRYQQRVGIEWALHEGESGPSLAPSSSSLPAVLKANGYATSLIGKWHLGLQLSQGPNAHGFDEFFGFLGGAINYYTHSTTGHGSDLYENTTRVATSGYLTDDFTARAERFIEQHRSSPFFLEVAYNAVHSPYQPPGLAPSDPKINTPLDQQPDDPNPATRADYVAMLERADLGIGVMLAALDRLGLSERTLVIFTNDNGGAWLSGNAPFSNSKGTLWEGGIRVPLIMRWPGRLAAGTTHGQVAATMDLHASIASATGSSLPIGFRPDGIDLFPMLSGRSGTVERALFWRIDQAARQQKAVRKGRWKLLLANGTERLYDLSVDPGERTNLAARNPDVVTAMMALLADWERDVYWNGGRD